MGHPVCIGYHYKCILTHALTKLDIGKTIIFQKKREGKNRQQMSFWLKTMQKRQAISCVAYIL